MGEEAEVRKKCKECGKVITGRVDKQFCSSHCKSAFNNARLRSDRSEVNRINRILDKNRKILIKHTPEGKKKMTISELKREGFDFKYYTHQLITGKGNVYHFCYEYGYMQLDDEHVLIVRQRG